MLKKGVSDFFQFWFIGNEIRPNYFFKNIGRSFKFLLKVGVEKLIVNAPLAPLQIKNTNNTRSEVRFKQLIHDAFTIDLNTRYNIARSNEILGWEGVGNNQLLRFFKAYINWSMLTANLKFRAKEFFFFFLSLQCFTLKIE
jgi:hypothetical protein